MVTEKEVYNRRQLAIVDGWRTSRNVQLIGIAMQVPIDELLLAPRSLDKAVIAIKDREVGNATFLS